MILRPLPPDAQRLCDDLQVPERLRQHLSLVHDVAGDLVERLTTAFPALILDKRSITFGAAIHDLGKVLHPEELTGPGHLHEIDGPGLLERHGIPPGVAKYARTHGTWSEELVELSDLVVALADNLWRGKRHEELEWRVVRVLAETSDQQQWVVFQRADEIFGDIAADGELRLAWQCGES